jgi:heme oxygenase (biliverdin-producing, ferredoxin)
MPPYAAVRRVAAPALGHHRSLMMPVTRPPEPLPARLRAATATAHARAERSLLMQRVMQGALPRAHYCRLLFALHGVYSVLDDAVCQTRPAQRLWQAALARTGLLALDLERLHGAGWGEKLDAGTEAVAYAARLRRLVTQEPHRLVAHAYVRYLGDLHGGQMLAAAVRRAFALPAGEGVAFYDFGPPAQVLALRAQLRQALEALPLTAQEADDVVDEACLAFDAHERMFAELA